MSRSRKDILGIGTGMSKGMETGLLGQREEDQAGMVDS